ncbi:OmpA family protein [Kordia algicida OT-1]|uniref:Phosphoglycerate kinase n=1 Tax=Kordia algicida OT-1 TaxID=391587 RepID=A9DS50_9FLAO|nr:OmpA family protein [Kordia algicida]EDP96886.1 phosphoglycerate kinase [Kordia algicida OT-1]
MKHLSRFLVALLLVVGFSNVKAQDENNPWQINIAVNAVDFYPTNDMEAAGITGKWFDEYFNVGDHYNILPTLSSISVSKYVGDGFSVGARGSVNRIEKYGDVKVEDLTYYGFDALIKYNINELYDMGKFDPYLEVGGGYTWVDDIGAGTVNGGLGFNYWFTENIAFNLQSTYKHSFEDYLAPHFQHMAGIAIKFGGKDTDEDGIYDKDDACPDVKGLPEFNGCPDTDGDGIEDSKDDCPDTAGLAALNGCPDTDGDGIADAKDDCPEVAGTAAMNGCPDADGDGITDAKDNCPNEAGPSANKGCPWTDKDGDGVLDKDDRCPEVAGVAENDGCPPIPRMTEIEITELDNLARTVYFNSGKDSFKQETYEILNKIVELIKGFPAEEFTIGGHTDSVGSDSLNQKLSEKRANAVKSYLESKLSNKFTAIGYGENEPIASNRTRKGRAQNRRVEIKLVKN